MTIVSDRATGLLTVFPTQEINQFKAGDIVKLKSGGPRMTVATTQGGTSRLYWFDRHGMNETSIPNDAIYRAEDRKNGAST